MTATATRADTSPAAPPSSPYTASLAAMTRPRPGKLRKVSAIEPLRYSPATAMRPKISVSTAASPTCASAWRWTAGSCTLPPDSTSPVTPATTISGPAASSSHGPRTVVTLRNSLLSMGRTSFSPLFNLF